MPGGVTRRQPQMCIRDRDGGQALVGGGFAILGQVAGGQQQVGMLAVGLDLAQHGAQAGVGVDACLLYTSRCV